MERAGSGTANWQAATARPQRVWLVPVSLCLLVALPALGGVYRALTVVLGGEVTAANQRFFEAPTPVFLHGIGCALFAFLGAFQFTPRPFRNQKRHRLRGMIFIPSALIVAITGLWMEATYELPAHDGPLLSVFRVVFSIAMIAMTLLGIRCLLRRQYAQHGAWMMRTYAIGMGAGTQVIAFLLWGALIGPAVGPSDVTSRALLMGGSWVFNVLFVEFLLRRKANRKS